MNEENEKSGKRSADENHPDAPDSSHARIEEPQSDSNKQNKESELFSLNVKVECSKGENSLFNIISNILIPGRRILMSGAILEKVNDAVKKAATKELEYQFETVYKPWHHSFANEKEKRIKLGNENYDAFRSN